MSEEIKENQGQDNDKISKKYDANIKKLVSIFNGEKAFKKAKLPNSDIKTIIDELSKEQKESMIKDFKEKASKLLKSKVDFDKFVKQKEDEFKNSVTNKKKEFNKEMEECFQMIENIENLEKSYYDSFNDLQKDNG